MKHHFSRSLAAITASMLIAVGAQGAAMEVAVTNPSNHRLQTYPSWNGVPLLYYAPTGVPPASQYWPGTQCYYVFPASTDAKRFHDFVLAAKLTGARYGFYVETTNCQVVTFYIDAP